MSRHLLVTGVLVASLFGGLSACTGSDDKPETKPTATKAPTTAAPTPAPQPKGADGVTYDVQNWDKYADDSAVLVWKQNSEALSGSSNKRKVVPGIRATAGKTLLRRQVRNLRLIWQNDWHVQAVVSAKVSSSSMIGDRARLVTCAWAPDEVLREKNGKPAAEVPKTWSRYVVDLAPRADSWVVSSIDTKGDCPGGAPS